ncbi:MAG: zf-CGNR multi-domain protein [Rhodoglobus sp.]|nr:zf-CGNR multi-domain protein [Rhodoglobus sp.]
MRQTVERPQGQWLTGGDGHTFWFDSGSLAVDFAYTGGFGKRQEWEQWHEPSDASTWLKGRFPEVDAAVGDREFADAKGLRDAIARSVLAAARGEGPSPADVDVINLFAATPDIPPSLAGGGRQAGRSRARVGQALSVMAREAVELLAPEERERIRECDGDHCTIVFYDESRSNNRRWCSMQRCGNRAKVRKHRSKEEAR